MSRPPQRTQHELVRKLANQFRAQLDQDDSYLGRLFREAVKSAAEYRAADETAADLRANHSEFLGILLDQLLDTESSASRQSYIETGEYLLRDLSNE